MVWERISDGVRRVLAPVRQSFDWVAAPARWRMPGWLQASVSPFVWIATKLGGLIVRAVKAIGAFFGWLLIPKTDSPLDVLKHYVSVIVTLMGLTALLWAAKQIAYPPIVITVAKLPEPIEKEYWLNAEFSRTLIDQIERMRAVVKDERTPAFEAVLNAPNIIVKTGEWSLNVQEQILTPLGSLLGRSQGEAHIAVTCFHPGCVRTSDSECREPIPKSAGDAAPGTKQYLCLRITVDISRGANQLRITPRLALSNDTYDAEITKQVARIAEAMMVVADPATAALYYYRRVQQERTAARSLTVDPELVVELRGEAFKAAEQAESHDTVSACWAHTIRARLAIDRRDFNAAETYIALARNIPWWRQVWRLTSPIDCQRLIAVAEMDFARRIVLPRDIQERPFPRHPYDGDPQRNVAAVERIEATLKEIEGFRTWAAFFGRSSEDADLIGALRIALSEVGLAWFDDIKQCGVVNEAAAPEPSGADAPEAAVHDIDDPTATEAELIERAKKIMQERSGHIAEAVRGSIRTIASLRPGERMTPLTRQAAAAFLERIGRNSQCTSQAEFLAKGLYLNHPNDPELAQVFARIIESVALKKKEEEREDYLRNAQAVYEGMLDIGNDKVDMFALGRMAFINSAFPATVSEENRFFGPDPKTLEFLKRAWQRYERELYPTDIRHRAEFILSFWGGLLLRSYADHVLDADLAGQGATADDLEMRTAAAQRREYLRAVQVLFPAVQAGKLADFSALSGIGTSISCMCLLSRLIDHDRGPTERGKGVDFYISRLNKWQQVAPSMQTCRADLLPLDKVAARNHALFTWIRLRRRPAEARRAHLALEAARKALQPDQEKIASLEPDCRVPKALSTPPAPPSR